MFFLFIVIVYFNLIILETRGRKSINWRKNESLAKLGEKCDVLVLNTKDIKFAQILQNFTKQNNLSINIVTDNFNKVKRKSVKLLFLPPIWKVLFKPISTNFGILIFELVAFKLFRIRIDVSQFTSTEFHDYICWIRSINHLFRIYMIFI
ncbi:hypothetical protein BpHYR1_051403 [Brachionus plicatilis]|uniref:Uncharacterized protein n=1 Tax=Brachionus plicatilis TaxID=10195 RepID=A0A3M7S206_BRAPC|nr:hypothetical protein BpHYR1_051403 [Brachionus plicatilis]